MAFWSRSAGSLTLISLLLLPLASCTNNDLGKALQNSLAADPKLRESAPDGTITTLTGQQNQPSLAQLPADFPQAIPRYPNAILQEVLREAEGSSGEAITTVWSTPDSNDQVLAFYRQQFQGDGWQLQQSLLTQPGTISAQQNNLQVTVSADPTANSPSSTPNPSPGSNAPAAGNQANRFTIRYVQSTSSAASPSPQASPQIEAFLGAEGTSEQPNGQTSGEVSAQQLPISYNDLEAAPQDLRKYLSDLAQLGVLRLSANAKEKSAAIAFEPNKPVSRREYARWLFETNNRLYRDRAAQQIRAASNASQPAFRDIPRTDPDFAAIQGLAEAGIIPSSLSGDPTAVTFRPNAQLSRETMLLWKVPMDTRQPLPTATLEAVQQAWGFQDAARIDPKAQRAILADYQNADLSNIRRVFGYTTLLQPKKPVTRAEAAATLWYFGYQGEGVSAQDALAR